MDISAILVKELRERTGVGFMDCKQALREANGDIDEAIKVLRTMGKAKAAKKAGRAATEGRIETYVHMGGKIAVLLELNCETDFVARNEEFVSLAHDLAMHVAAANPKHIGRDEVDATTLEAERQVYREQAVSEGKPDNIIDKIVDGKINRFLAETCLLEQGFVKEPDKKVTDLITDAVTKLGENIRVGRFSRLAIGDSDATLAVSNAVSSD